jgi:hypothetical protein
MGLGYIARQINSLPTLGRRHIELSLVFPQALSLERFAILKRSLYSSLRFR